MTPPPFTATPPPTTLGRPVCTATAKTTATTTELRFGNGCPAQIDTRDVVLIDMAPDGTIVLRFVSAPPPVVASPKP